MSDGKTPRNFSPNQEKIIRRYYDNLDNIKTARLSDLVGELYLATGKKKEKAWQDVASALAKLEVGQVYIDHLLEKRDPALVAEYVKNLQRTK